MTGDRGPRDEQGGAGEQGGADEAVTPDGQPTPSSTPEEAGPEVSSILQSIVPTTGASSPSAAPVSRFSPHQVLAERYRLVRCLGEGAFAEVWLAVEEAGHGFSKRVALKLLKSSGTREDDERLTALLDEARLCGMLHHPRLVDVYGVGEARGITFIAMEYVEGFTLFQLLADLRKRERRLPASVIADIGIQLCEGLDYAHSATDHAGEPLGLVHRDLKPANVMLTRRGGVKIADFGLAQASTSTLTTQAGILRGTPAYLAPEVWRGDRTFGPPTDLFAVGAILFELAVGEPLMTGDLPVIITRAIHGDASADMVRLRLHRPELVPVVRGLLERDPGERTQTAWGALDGLRSLRRRLDAPGGLELFLDLVLPRPASSDSDGSGGRLRTLPQTSDREWTALFDAEGVVSTDDLEGPHSEGSALVPPTRQMSLPAPEDPVAAPRSRQIATALGIVTALLLGSWALWAVVQPDRQVVDVAPSVSAEKSTDLAPVEAATEPDSPGPADVPTSSVGDAEADPPDRGPTSKVGGVTAAADARLDRGTGPTASAPEQRPPTSGASLPEPRDQVSGAGTSPAAGDRTERRPTPPAEPEPEVAAPAEGCLVLQSSPPGASVWLAGEETPLVAGSAGTRHALPAGSVRVGMGLDAASLVEVAAEVSPGNSTVVRCDLIGGTGCSVRASPRGCE